MQWWYWRSKSVAREGKRSDSAKLDERPQVLWGVAPPWMGHSANAGPRMVNRGPAHVKVSADGWEKLSLLGLQALRLITVAAADRKRERTSVLYRCHPRQLFQLLCLALQVVQIHNKSWGNFSSTTLEVTQAPIMEFLLHFTFFQRQFVQNYSKYLCLLKLRV